MADASRIAELNDRFRKDPARWGRAYVTDGVAGHGPEFVRRAMAAMAAFDAFTAGNDPYGERDFGSLKLDDQTLFWKIEYFDKADLDFGADDPSNPVTTARVVTLMLADEY